MTDKRRETGDICRCELLQRACDDMACADISVEGLLDRLAETDRAGQANARDLQTQNRTDRRSAPY